jgi:hypothetical protein
MSARDPIGIIGIPSIGIPSIMPATDLSRRLSRSDRDDHRASGDADSKPRHESSEESAPPPPGTGRLVDKAV